MKPNHRKGQAWTLAASVIFAGLVPGVLAGAQEDTLLTGRWDGRRSDLETQGLTLEFVLTTEWVRNVSGGLEQEDGLLGNVDLTFELDTEQAGWWSAGTFFVYALGNFHAGEEPSTLVGDIQATSNIEAPETLKIYELWYSHGFLDDRVSLLFGLHDYNSEFDVLEVAGVFRNSSFGISPDISQVEPSIFPTTALATRLQVRWPGWYLLAAVYDGVPGDPHNDRGTHVLLRREDGLFYAAEAGLTRSEAGSPGYFKAAVGGWFKSRDFEDFQGAPRRHNYGVYAIGEKSLGGRGLAAFWQLGFAREDRNELAHYLGAGLTYTGLLPRRDDDTLGLGVAFARYASAFRQVNPGLSAGETAIELTYQARVLPWLSLQPDLQYILSPGAEPGTADAFQVGLSWQIEF